MQNIINNSPGVHVIGRSAFYNNLEHSVARTSYNNQTFPYMPGNQFEMLVSIKPTFWEVIYFELLKLIFCISRLWVSVSVSNTFCYRYMRLRNHFSLQIFRILIL